MLEKIRQYFRGVVSEIKAITWPTRKKVYYDSLVVLAALVIGGAIVALLDYGFASAFKAAITQIEQI